MRYLEKEGVWLLPAPEGERHEILVPGDAHAPNASLLEFAGRVLPDLATLRSRAVSFLDEFVRPTASGASADWYLEGIDFGYPEPLAAGQFRLSFTREDDVYGYWSVVFQESSSRYFPVTFSRESQ